MRALSELLSGATPARMVGWVTPRRGTQARLGLAYGRHERHRLDLTLPREARADTPLVVFFHGGAWQEGGRGEYAFVSRLLAARGVAVAVPDYRLWPEARWPDFLQDGAAALAWLAGPGGAAAGVPRGKVFVMGHSAGGFIAAALALDPRWTEQAGLQGGRAALDGVVLVSAPIAWQPTDEPIRSIFATAPGGMIQAMPDPAALSGAPPALLLHGAADTVVGPFHSERLAAALGAAGRPARLRILPGLGHIGPMAAMSAPALALGWPRAPVLAEVLDFLRDPGAGRRDPA